MGTFIIKLGDRYLEYSTVVDGAASNSMPLKEFTEYYKTKYGTAELDRLQSRLDRADNKGTSSIHPWEDLRVALGCDRSGKREGRLTALELYNATLSDEAWEARPTGVPYSYDDNDERENDFTDLTISEDGTKLILPKPES